MSETTVYSPESYDEDRMESEDEFSSQQSYVSSSIYSRNKELPFLSTTSLHSVPEMTSVLLPSPFQMLEAHSKTHTESDMENQAYRSNTTTALPVSCPVSMSKEQKPWLYSFDPHEYGKVRPNIAVNMYDSTSLERFDVDFGLTPLTRDLYYIDLFHQYRYFNPRASQTPNIAQPIVLHKAWDKFITEFQQNPSAWRDGFLRRTKNYYMHSYAGAMIQVHRLCTQATLPCAVRGKYRCPMCVQPDTRVLPASLPEEIEMALDGVRRQYAKTKPLRQLHQGGRGLSSSMHQESKPPANEVADLIQEYMMKERMARLELEKQVASLNYKIADLKTQVTKLQYECAPMKRRFEFRPNEAGQSQHPRKKRSNK